MRKIIYTKVNALIPDDAIFLSIDRHGDLLFSIPATEMDSLQQQLSKKRTDLVQVKDILSRRSFSRPHEFEIQDKFLNQSSQLETEIAQLQEKINAIQKS